MDLDYKRGDLNEKFNIENLKYKEEIFDSNLEKFKINENLYFIPRLKKFQANLCNYLTLKNFLILLKS